MAVLLQVLPFASDETLDQLEKNIAGMPAINDLLDMGATPAAITQMLLEGLGVSEGSTTIVPR
jgi:molecular chaperone Hsp33